MFFDSFKGHQCFHQEHLEGRWKEQRGNSNNKELAPNNKNIMYQRNIYLVLDECEMLMRSMQGGKNRHKLRAGAREKPK